MDPKFRTLVVTVLAVLVAVYIGWSIADGRYAVATLLSCVISVAMIERSRWMPPEAAVLLVLVAGYVLGNRGFAQVMPVPTLPLLPGEIGLAVAAGLVLIRGMADRQLPLRTDAASRLLLFWMALGAGRMAWDLRVYGFMALRDFAMVYYAGFYFLAFTITRRSLSLQALHRGLVVVFALLPPAALLVQVFPDFFMRQFTLRGVPLLYYKGDLLATFLGAGFFLLLPGPGVRHAGWRLLRILWAVFSLAFSMYLMSRSTMVGVAVALVGCWVARRFLAWRVATATVAAGLLLTAVMALFSSEDIRQSKLYSFYEHVASLTDFSGTRQYVSREAAGTGGNNQFRTKWWWAIARDTWAEAPVFGLGFGADLTKGFIQDYDPLTGDDFSARSPHNIGVTVLGRMGLVGAVVWLGFMLMLVRDSWRAARAVRAGEVTEDALSLHAVAWVILVSAVFGVVLEGPMGAVPFWVILGMAHAASVARETETAQPAASPAAPRQDEPRQLVANS